MAVSLFIWLHTPREADANHHYTYEHLKLFLIPEVDEAAKVQNINTMQAANAIKAQRLIDYANGKAGIKKRESLAKKLLLSDWMKKCGERKEEVGAERKQCRNDKQHPFALDKVQRREDHNGASR